MLLIVEFRQQRWYEIVYPPTTGGKVRVATYSAYSVQMLGGVVRQGLPVPAGTETVGPLGTEGLVTTAPARL